MSLWVFEIVVFILVHLMCGGFKWACFECLVLLIAYSERFIGARMTLPLVTAHKIV